jgi:hypothetical protein
MPLGRVWLTPLFAGAVITVLVLSSGAGFAQSAAAPSAHGKVLTTPGACSQKRVPLGAAGNFRILAGTTITNTGATTVNGNIGVSPGSSVTGFPPGSFTGAKYVADTAAAHGQLSLTTAYNNAMGRSTCSTLIAGNIGGKTFGPGLYHSTSTLTINSGDLTLNAHGNGGAVFIFQIASKFTMTSGRHVILTHGAKAANIFWAMGSSATFGTTSVIYGNLLAHKSISFATGATLHGRALAHLGAVTLAGNTVTHLPFTTPSVPTRAAAPTAARTHS